MRKKLLAFTLLLFSVAIYAGERSVLSILMKDGSEVCFYLSEQPMVRFVGDDVNINSITEEFSIARKQVERFAFLDAMPTGIENVEVPSDMGGREEVTIENGSVSVDGLTAGTDMRIYTIKGQLVASTLTDSEGNATLSLASLPAGIYLINYDDTTIKFIKR